jgi:hypothetical protein
MPIGFSREFYVMGNWTVLVVLLTQLIMSIVIIWMLKIVEIYFLMWNKMCISTQIQTKKYG